MEDWNLSEEGEFIIPGSREYKITRNCHLFSGYYVIFPFQRAMKIAVPSNLELDKVISQIRNLKNVIKINRM